MRISIGIEVLIHILQHVLDAYLLTITDRPNAVELQTFYDGTLENEYRCCARPTDKVYALGIQGRNGFGEHRVMVASQESDTVGTNECSTILSTSVDDALFHRGTFLRLFAKACRDDDESLCAFLLRQQFDVIGAQLGWNDKDGQFGWRQFAGVVKHLDALHLVLLGVHHTQGSSIASLQEISYDSATGFVYVVRPSDDNNTLGF